MATVTVSGPLSIQDLSRPSVIKKKNISLIATGSTLLGTTFSNGNRFIIQSIYIVPKTITGVANAPTVSVGVTGASYVDLVAATAGVSTTVNVKTALTVVSTSTSVAASTSIYLDCSVASTSDSFVADVYIIGVYEG